MHKKKRKIFVERVRRGREFERWERSQWKGELNENAEFEAQTKWRGKRGRVDIRLIDSQDGNTIVVEIKATKWDAMKAHRVRPNAMRHARQLWRYVDAELENQDATPAIIYPKSPKVPGRKQQIEDILIEQFIQVVWRDERK